MHLHNPAPAVTCLGCSTTRATAFTTCTESFSSGFNTFDSQQWFQHFRQRGSTRSNSPWTVVLARTRSTVAVSVDNTNHPSHTYTHRNPSQCFSSGSSILLSRTCLTRKGPLSVPLPQLVAAAMLLSSPVRIQEHCFAGRQLHNKETLCRRRTASLAIAQPASWHCSVRAASAWQQWLQPSSRIISRAGRTGGVQHGEAGSLLAGSITSDISAADSLAALKDVVLEWGGNFGVIQTSAALVKLAKLPEGRSAAAQELLLRLNSWWEQQLPDAGNRALANVLWAWGKLGAADSKLWDGTLAVFVADTAAISVSQSRAPPQHCANVLWACAKLRRPPSAEQLQVMLEALGHPEVLQRAAPQAVANAVWAVSQFRTMPVFQSDISPQLVQQLLGRDQLQLVGFEGAPQAVANLLVALARLATGPGPLLSQTFAQDCAQQLLEAAKQRNLRDWVPQDVSDGLCACAQLQLSDVMFVEAASRAMPECLPFISIDTIGPVALACARMQHRDTAFIAQLLQRGTQLCKQQLHISGTAMAGRSVKPIASHGQTAEMAAELAVAVAALDLRQLAGDVTSVVSSSGIKQQHNTHPAILRRLFQVHVWLRRHQLLDGRGLSRLLTEQQLQQGAQDAAAWGGKGR